MRLVFKSLCRSFVVSPCVLGLAWSSLTSCGSPRPDFEPKPESETGSTSSGGEADIAGGEGGGGGQSSAKSGGASSKGGSESDGGSGGGGGSGSGASITTGGSDGAGGDVLLPMACDAAEDSCQCDDSGCVVLPGGSCVRNSDCASSACENNQEGESICCELRCMEGQVCADDGSGCQAEAECDGGFRCKDDYQRCENGAWLLEEACAGLGCSLELGGCLKSAGQSCSTDEECGEGTCHESEPGESVCCSVNCGDCKSCSGDGMSCTALAESRPGCECEPDDARNCVDDISCTDDVCVNGQCENPVADGFCLIGGQCVSNATEEPNNPCRFCDAETQPTAWSSSGSTTSCDDGRWCNGSDSCDGMGSCEHEFANGNRCSAIGDCALAACSEQRDACVEPLGTECSRADERRCQNSECGGDVQVRTVVGYCDGASASCDDMVPESWRTQTNCSADQKCDPSTLGCVDALGCGDTWCDIAAGLCWTTAAASTQMNLAEAQEYCSDLVEGGRSDWRLPEANELASVSRGCDDGTRVSVDVPSTCRLDAPSGSYVDCDSCVDSGPSGGCYWPTVLGNCPLSDAFFWSATGASSFPGAYYYYRFRTSNFGLDGSGVGGGPTTTEMGVRCVVTL